MRAIGVWILSILWSSASELINLLLKVGVLKGVSLGCRVMSVGNIQAGGSGKTPLVIQIAKEAVAKGLKVCILSRGYKSEWERTGGFQAW